MSRSIIQKYKDECFVCGEKRNLEEHHIFQGSNRSLSEHYGLKVMLCHRCHNEPPEGAHFNNALRRELHAVGQLAFEKKYGPEKFMNEFGRDYIEAGIEEGHIKKDLMGLYGRYGLLKKWERLSH